MAAAATARDSVFLQLCAELNSDAATSQRAWNLWTRSSALLCAGDIYGDRRMWYSIVLYVAGHVRTRRPGESPAYFSISSLLRAANITPIAFYQRLEDFAKRAMRSSDQGDGPTPDQLLQHAQQAMARIEVTMVIAPRFDALLSEYFPPESSTTPRALQRAKAREAAWTLFALVKGRANQIESDLVSASCLALLAVRWICDALPGRATWAEAHSTDSNLLAALSNGNPAVDLSSDLAHVEATVWGPQMQQLVDEGMAATTSVDTRSADFDQLGRFLRDAYGTLIEERGLVDERMLLSVGAPPQVTESPGTKSRNAIALVKSLVPVCTGDALPVPLIRLGIQAGARAGWDRALLAFVGELSSEIHRAIAGANWFSTSLQEFVGLTVAFFYKILEDLAKDERARGGPAIDALVSSDALCRAVMACSLEVMILTYRLPPRTSLAAASPAHAAASLAHPPHSLASLAFPNQPTTSAPTFGLPSVTLPTAPAPAPTSRHESMQSGPTFPWSLQTTHCSPWAFQRGVEVVVRAVAGLSKAAMRHLAWCEHETIVRLLWQRPALEEIETALSSLPPGPIDVESPKPAAGAATAGPPVPRRAVVILFRKVLHLVQERLQQLCSRLPGKFALHNIDLMQSISRAAIQAQPRLLADRGIDDVILCAIMTGAKLSSVQLSFSELVTQYKRLPHAHLSAVAARQPDGTSLDIVEFYNRIFLPTVEPLLPALHHTTSSPTATLGVSLVHSPRIVSRHAALCVTSLPEERRETGAAVPSSAVRYVFHVSPAKSLSSINKVLHSPSTKRPGSPLASDEKRAASPSSVACKLFQD
eukprot:m.85538 g.85538  ORF g.85538 m.85538 type:complete len:819 (+) comp13515_c0_seq2:226-2682(+)